MNKLSDRILSLLKSGNYRPVKQHDLAKLLNIKPGKRNQFRTVLKEMQQSGVIEKKRGNRIELSRSTAPTAQTGDLRIVSKGNGFITVDDESVEDFYVAPENLFNAINGDRVQFVPVASRRKGRSRRHPDHEARVTAVVERRISDVVGLLMKMPAYSYIIPDDPRMNENITVSGWSDGLAETPGYHKVVVKLDPFDPQQSHLAGTLIEDLGNENEPGVDIASIARRKGFKPAHEAATSKAAREIQPLQNLNRQERRDLRNRLIFTIDPEDAKDFDDAISIQKQPDGGWQLGIHIADVSHYVTPGTPVDEEAWMRGNSVYLVDRVLPMLPAHLTTNVCSLVPNEDRLTHSVEVVLNSELEVVSADTFPSIIHSKARLNYGQVQTFLKEGKADELSDEIQGALTLMHQVASRLRKKRMINGSIDLSLPEVKCLLDNKGRTRRIVKRTEHDSYHLIEEFMLLANQVVAGVLIDHNFPGLFRVHPGPDNDQWKRMTAELNELGVAGKFRNRHDINRVAAETRNTPIEYAAGLAILRNFKQAVYANACSEHFGLAFERYTHFTSPIRRYPDLVVHRILKAVEKKETPPYSPDQLSETARHCSDTERAAMEAERESLDLKRIEYYMNQYRQNKTGPYKAIISAILPIGIMAELLESQQRGLIHFSSLGRDRYIVNKNKTRATGRHEGQQFAIGMQIDVQIIRVDERNNQVDFKLLSGGTQSTEPPVEKAYRQRLSTRSQHHRGRTAKKNRTKKKRKR